MIPVLYDDNSEIIIGPSHILSHKYYARAKSFYQTHKFILKREKCEHEHWAALNCRHEEQLHQASKQVIEAQKEHDFANKNLEYVISLRKATITQIGKYASNLKEINGQKRKLEHHIEQHSKRVKEFDSSMKQNHEVIQTLANNNINMYDIDPITCNLSKENKQIAEQRLLAEQSIAQHRADIANCEKKRINTKKLQCQEIQKRDRFIRIIHTYSETLSKAKAKCVYKKSLRDKLFKIYLSFNPLNDDNLIVTKASQINLTTSMPSPVN